MNSQGNRDSLEKLSGQSSNDDVSINDLIRFLRGLSTLLDHPQSGNPRLAHALGRLARALQRFSDQSLNDLIASLSERPPQRRTRQRTPSTRFEGLNLSAIELTEVREILKSQDLTKEELILLGTSRFGIPRSGLERQNKIAVLEAVESAIRNEESLSIISREASRYGSSRSS